MTTESTPEGPPADRSADEHAPPPGVAETPTADDAMPWPEDEVIILDLDGRRLVLVGTAHISQHSVDLVRQVIEAERPDTVCLELDPQRYQALAEQRKWEALDLRQVIRNKQLTTLLVNLLLASYQKRLGENLGVEPGRELLEAAQTAEALDIPIELCDRDVRVTLRRAARATPFHRKLMLMSYLLAGIFDREEISEEQLEELKKRDALNELLGELGAAMPTLKTALIDERDSYLATKLRRAPGERIVAVVGAGHLRGMIERLEAGTEADLAALDQIPPVSPVWKIIGWGIPAIILGALGYIGLTQGRAEAAENAWFWFLANGIPTGLGTALAAGHPMTILLSFLAAPFTSLTPLIGAGYVAAFVQAYARPPVVKEFQTVVQDAGTFRRWWGNRLLRVFLVFVLATLGSMIGTWLGAGKILSSLV